MGNLLSPELKRFVRSAKNVPGYVHYENSEIATASMREILSLMERFPDAGIDDNEDEKFTLYHGIQFQKRRPDAVVESGTVCMECLKGTGKCFHDVREHFTPVANMSEQEFMANPARGFEKFRIRDEEGTTLSPDPAM